MWRWLAGCLGGSCALVSGASLQAPESVIYLLYAAGVARLVWGCHPFGDNAPLFFTRSADAVEVGQPSLRGTPPRP
jgi:hypothetical protein